MHGYSLHVIRGAIPFPDARHKLSELLASMAHVETNSGLKKVRVGAAKQIYRNLELVSGDLGSTFGPSWGILEHLGSILRCVDALLLGAALAISSATQKEEEDKNDIDAAQASAMALHKNAIGATLTQRMEALAALEEEARTETDGVKKAVLLAQARMESNALKKQAQNSADLGEKVRHL